MTFVIRAAPGEVHIDRLRQVTEIAQQVIAGDIDTTEGAKRLKAVQRQPPLYPAWIMVAAYALMSAALGRVFGGGSGEMAVAALAGLCIGLLSMAGQSSPWIRHLLPTLAALMTTQIVWILPRGTGQSVAPYVALIAGLVILLPGLSLTIAMAELATQNLVSGTARLFGAGSVFLQLAFGTAIGVEIAGHRWSSMVTTPPSSLPEWTLWLSVAVGSAALLPLFSARLRELGWFLLAGLLAFAVTRYSQLWASAPVAAFLGAVSIGILANAAGRYLNLPGATLLMPGFIMLVPGSIGYKSMLALLQHDPLSGFEKGFEVVLVGMALIAGLLLASLVRLPKRDDSDLPDAV
jgi:uncharacterized membrane protein YjjP (DUF1212 family)